jgi:AMP-polyphosphate phosphotransferase
MILIKFWLQISDEEQLRRFERRERKPLKAWKLTDEDWRNRGRREEYTAAVEDMVARTDRPDAHWDVVPADSKRYARVAVLETVIERIEAGMRQWGFEPPPPLSQDDG